MKPLISSRILAHFRFPHAPLNTITMNTRPSLAAVASTLLMLLFTAAAPGALVVAPYQNDFSAGAADFVPTSGASPSGWSASGGTYTNVNTRPSANPINHAYGWSTVTVSNLGGVTDQSFSMSSQVTLTDLTTFGTGTAYGRVGLLFLSNGSTTGYFASLTTMGSAAGSVELTSIGDLATANAAVPNLLSGSTTGNFGSVAEGTTFNFDLEGTYDELGALSLTFTVTNTTDASVRIATATVASPLSGQEFGYVTFAASTNTGTRSQTAQFDDFSVVPEPGAPLLSLGALGLLLTGARRRRREV